MPPALLFDYTKLDLNKVEYDRTVISQVNPQAYEMSQLDVIVWHDLPQMLCLGYKDVTDKEFWFRGHIPGRPIMPGVIMIECAAQLCSFFMRQIYGLKGFIGFSGIDETKFRETVIPGNRLYLLGHIHKVRSRQFSAKVQGVINDKLAFETVISGMNV
jgi:3-hydroxyacyl-[acyl-carrier-protein] dehydratase